MIQAGAGTDADSCRRRTSEHQHRRTSAPTGGAVGLLVLLALLVLMAPDCGQSFMYHLRLL